jgi:hypothetical protein
MEIVVSSEGALGLAGPEDFRSFRVVVPKAVAPSVVSAALDVIGRSDGGGHVFVEPRWILEQVPTFPTLLLSTSAGGRDSTACCPTRPARAGPTPTAGSEPRIEYVVADQQPS